MVTAVEKHVSSKIFKLKLKINLIKHMKQDHIHYPCFHHSEVVREYHHTNMAALRRAVKKHVEQVMMENHNNVSIFDGEKFEFC